MPSIFDAYTAKSTKPLGRVSLSSGSRNVIQENFTDRMYNIPGKSWTERTQMFEIFKEFTFEAAHHLAVNVVDGHRYSRLHGHSFQVQVFLKGEPDEKKNWLCDFGEIEQRVAELRTELDHNYLNEIAGLEVPTLENISRWIWNRLNH